MSNPVTFDLSTASPELLALLMQQQGSNLSVPSEYTGPGGIKFSTAAKVRNGLWSRQGYDENVTVSLNNGMTVSLLMLKTTKRWSDSRPSDGKRGQDYYLIWEMSDEVGQKVASYLEQYNEAPKQQRGNGNRSGGQQSAGNSTADIQSIVQQQLAVVLQQLGLNVPQQPTLVQQTPIAPAAGFTIGEAHAAQQRINADRQAGNDVDAVDLLKAAQIKFANAQQEVPTFYPGQAIRCGLTGEVRYVSDAGIVRTVKNPS
jgi:hypothetical protein